MRFLGGKWEKKNRGSDKGHRFNGLMFPGGGDRQPQKQILPLCGRMTTKRQKQRRRFFFLTEGGQMMVVSCKIVVVRWFLADVYGR
jgi:hypothetical protein